MSTNLPEQVRKQSAEVQALYEELGGEGQDPKLDNQDNPDESGKKPAGEGKDPAAEAATKTDDATLPESKERTDKGKSKQQEEWEHKYKTLQGMHKTEMQKLRDENHDLGSKIKNLENLIAGMSSNEPDNTSMEVKAGSIVTEEDQENYGASIEVMRRVSREEMAPVMQQLKTIQASLSKMTTEVLPRVDNLANAHAKTATEKFWDALDVMVPDWKVINNNDDFQTWLLMSDPMSGYVRQDLLAEAQKKGDAGRVSNFFKTWIAETGYDGKNSKTDTAHADVNEELESQIAPGVNRTSDRQVNEGGKRKIDRAFIQQFYLDVSKGKYKGNEDERRKIEADIFAAQSEGRVV